MYQFRINGTNADQSSIDTVRVTVLQTPLLISVPGSDLFISATTAAADKRMRAHVVTKSAQET